MLTDLALHVLDAYVYFLSREVCNRENVTNIIPDNIRACLTILQLINACIQDTKSHVHRENTELIRSISLTPCVGIQQIKAISCCCILNVCINRSVLLLRIPFVT